MIEDLARHWLAAMLGVSIQFTVLAAIAAAALLVSRTPSPRVRHAIWLLVLLRLTIPVGLSSPFGAVPASLVEPRSTGAPPEEASLTSGLLEASTVASPEAASHAGSGDRAASTQGANPAASPTVVLFLAWGAGVLVLTSAHLVRAARRRVRTRDAKVLPPGPAQRVDQLRRELGPRRPVDARMVPDDAVAGPVVQGFVRPRVLLPARLVRSWQGGELDLLPARLVRSRQGGELDPILLHELIHLRRRDPAVRALGNLLQIVYFFHPLVWWVGRRLAAERERACDDAVVRRLPGGKRTYIDCLLRLVEERSPAYDTPGLGMVPGRRPLALRLKRMLRRRYEPESATGVLSLAALVIGVGLGLALSTEARPPRAAQPEQPPRILTGTSWRDAFLADSVEEIDGAERVNVGGDFTIGRALTPLTPDLPAPAAGNPDLFDRLDELGSLTATLIVDRAGRVRRVRFGGDIDDDLRRPFLDVLEIARFEPTTHVEHGAVIVEVKVDYHINLALPRQSLYHPGETFVGDEVGDVLPDPGRERGPRFAAILAKDEAPALDLGDGELLLSFLLSVDGAGNVESVTPFRDPRRNLLGQPDSTEESEALVPYLKTFRFEPILRRGAPVAGTLMVDLRVSRRGVEVATRRVDENELERRLAEIYGLPEGQNLDLLPPPHPPERGVLYRTGSPVQARAVPWGADMMTIVWTAGGPSLRGACFGCGDLLAVVDVLGVRRASVRFEGGARNVPIDADIVMREGASRAALLDDLPRVLEERFDLNLDFRIATEPSPTLVLRGAVGELPADDELGGQRVLHVFTDGRDERGPGGGGTLGNVGELAELMSRHLLMPVVNETSGPVAQPFRAVLHGSAFGTRRLDLLTRNLESQTDLDIVVEDRPNEILVVSPEPR